MFHQKEFRIFVIQSLSTALIPPPPLRISRQSHLTSLRGPPLRLRRPPITRTCMSFLERCAPALLHIAKKSIESGLRHVAPPESGSLALEPGRDIENAASYRGWLERILAPAKGAAFSLPQERLMVMGSSFFRCRIIRVRQNILQERRGSNKKDTISPLCRHRHPSRSINQSVDPDQNPNVQPANIRVSATPEVGKYLSLGNR